MKKHIMAGALSVGLLLTGGIATFAGTAWDYNISVYIPNHAGSGGNTQYQTKATSGADAGLALHATQGVEVDVRTYGMNGNGNWLNNIKGGQGLKSVHSVTTSGYQERLQFKTDLFEGQNVQAVLDWRSN